MTIFLTSLILFASYIVVQGDTIKFFNKDATLAKKILLTNEFRNEKVNGIPMSVSLIEKAFVSENGKYLLLYHLETTESVLKSSVKFMNSQGKVNWQKQTSGQYQYSPYCALVHNQGFAIILYNNFYGQEPTLYFISNKGNVKQLTKKKWHSIVNIFASTNGRFIVTNTRYKERRYLWDCLLFIDLKNSQEWTHTFPDCLSCSRPRAIKIKIDDDGTTRATYKNERYIFASDGRILSISYL